MTTEQIGREIGLTRERVRQIEIEALDKLNERMASDKPLTQPTFAGRRQRGRRRKVARAELDQPAPRRAAG